MEVGRIWRRWFPHLANFRLIRRSQGRDRWRGPGVDKVRSDSRHILGFLGPEAAALITESCPVVRLQTVITILPRTWPSIRSRMAVATSPSG